MQDILIRYKRMQGYNALWQPGTDHASIATEVKVIQSLKEKGIDKADLGRVGFLEKCWEWREEYGNREWFLAAVYFCMEVTVVFPFFIKAFFNALWVIGLC